MRSTAINRPPVRRSRASRLIAAVAIAAPLLAAPASGVRAQGEPPHAWLFGTWTGGLFPAPSTITAAACLAQPVVIFTRDIVMRASLTDVTYTQRVVATARTNPGVTDFQFSPAVPASSGLFGGPVAPTHSGFGCENPDVLHVQRRTDNEIVFPGCADFPNPLVRCPSR